MHAHKAPSELRCHTAHTPARLEPLFSTWSSRCTPLAFSLSSGHTQRIIISNHTYLFLKRVTTTHTHLTSDVHGTGRLHSHKSPSLCSSLFVLSLCARHTRRGERRTRRISRLSTAHADSLAVFAAMSTRSFSFSW